MTSTQQQDIAIKNIIIYCNYIQMELTESKYETTNQDNSKNITTIVLLGLFVMRFVYCTT